MNALTVRSKIALAYTLVFGLIFAGFALLVYSNTRETALAKLDASLLTYAGRIEAEVEEQTAERLFPAPGEFRALSPGDLVDQRYLLRARDGSPVLEDSLLLLVPFPSGVPSGWPGKTETISFGGRNFRVYTGPVEVDDTTAYFVAAAAPMAGVESALESLRMFFLFSVPAVLLLAGLAAWLIARAAFSPVSAMITTARNISADNLSARLDLPPAVDEIRLLGETLNGMMDRIEKAFRAQRQFVADASHEMRTPLTVIRSELEFLGKHSRSHARSEEIDRIVAEVDRLVKMGGNLLLLSRLDAAPASLERTLLRIDELIVECVRDLHPLFRGKGVALRVHIAEALEVRGDREGMKRMLLNLLENSLKYTKRGGRVHLSLACEKGAALPVTVTVHDTGCGIAPADLPHIFGRFYRSGETRGDGGGSGLGLAIVDHIVKLHGGMIAVQSEPGKWTTFVIHLPPASP